MGQSHHTGAPWYAVHCRPMKEWLASASLSSQLGLEVYLPEIKCRLGDHEGLAPFFPRYLFIQADLQVVAKSSINATPGVVKLVSFSETPQPISGSVIEALRERIDRLNEQGGLLQTAFEPGSTVRLRHGPLRGLEAIFVESLEPQDRVRVLIEFLGRQRIAEVPVDALDLVTVPDRHPPRRTRGRGRAIKLHAGRDSALRPNT